MTSGVPSVVTCVACAAKNRVPDDARGVPRCGRCHAPLPWVVQADDATVGPVVDAATIPVLVDLWASWCGPCHAVSPVLERLAREFAGSVKLAKIDVDQASRTADRFSVRGVPTLLLLSRGEVVARHVGAGSEATLRSWLQDALRQVHEMAED